MTVTKLTTSKGDLRGEVRAEVGADGTRRRRTRRHKSERAARRADARFTHLATEGTLVDPTSVTVSEYLEGWVAGRIDLLSTTRTSYTGHLSSVFEEYGDLPLAALTKAHIDQLVRDMTVEGRAPRTVVSTLTVLSTALDAAVKESVLSRNPVKLVNRPRIEDRVQAHAWTRDQAMTFLATAGQTREAGLWWLSLCGLRRGEVLGVTWDDVDLEGGAVRVERARVLENGKVVVNPPKSRLGRRTVPLPEPAVLALRELRSRQQAERSCLAAGPVSGFVAVYASLRPIRPEWYSDEFQRLAKVAQLPRIRLHDVRHTAASLLVSLGVHPVVAAAALGHDPVVFSRIYAHAYDDDKRTAMNLLGDLLTTSH